MERSCFLISMAIMLLVQCLSSLSAMAVTTISSDHHALLAFKAHITSDPHHILAKNWSTTTSICNWIGVICSTRHKRVAALNLSYMGLIGTIPANIGNLSFLVSLDFSNNSFQGHLPKELAHLGRLKEIKLGFNNFSGGLPLWFDVLTKLRTLILTRNSFTGTIPLSLGNLSKLEILNIHGNSLQGKIPQEIGNLGHLKRLALGYNQLTGAIPPAIFNISSLERIILAKNSLSGKLPVDMCNRLPKLEWLALPMNQLYGQIPLSIKECSNLQILSLEANKFSGAIPRAIGNLTMLQELFLDKNNLKGVIPQEIGSLYNLNILSLDFNSLSGNIPATIFNISTLQVISIVANQLSGKLSSNIGHRLPILEVLYLGLNDLTGILPDSISNASKLISLDIGFNKLTGTIPKLLGNLGLLEYISIGDNNLVNESPSTELSFLNSMSNCKHLQVLWIGGNPLKGILPVSIGNLSSSLEAIDASECGTMGNIPQEIGNLSNLAFLILYGNELTGFIPIAIKGLWKLQVLNFGDNKIQGTIPNDLCQLPNLGHLNLSINEISGTVPSCLGNITSQRYLDLSSNKLTSSIPASLGRLQVLMLFSLFSNSLSGNIPPEIGNLKAAVQVDLSFNQLSGNIPSTIGGLQNMINLSLAHNRLRGPIPETFQNLISLEMLDLSRNNLSGVIPKSLEALLHLRYFNVSFNSLRGEIPSGGPFKNFTNQSFLQNEALCGASWFQVPLCHTGSVSKSKTKKVLLGVCIPLVIALIMLMTFALLFKRWRRRNEIPTPTGLVPSTILHGRLSYLELQRATDGFNESNLLGMGSFGSVYKGILSNGTILAIKVFNVRLEGAFKSFDTECEVLRNLRHRNLTKVVNSCSNPDFRALILEYMPNGSFEKWLYSHNHFLDISQRLDIMIDVASALDYLHHGYSTPVVHCDLKPGNVLLDENMVAHLSDFGIAKLLGAEESIAQTMTLATLGYIAPEYGMEGLVSIRSDVYSYGIMLMETFTRKKPGDEMFLGDLSLKHWVNDSLPNAILQVIDANLLRPEQEHFIAKVQCLSSVMALALRCSTESPEERINIKDALAMLKKIKLQFLGDLERA